MLYSRFVTILALSTLIDAIIFGAVFFLPWSSHGGPPHAPPQNLRRLLQALVATLAVFTVKLPVCRAMGFNLFGVIHLAYLDLFLVAPLAGLTILAVSMCSRRSNPGQRVSPAVRIIALLALLLAPFGVYATYIEPYRLKSETTAVPLPAQRSGMAPIRVGIVADVQTERVTDYERTAFNRVLAEHPDIVLLPGDFFQGSRRALHEQTPALRKLLCSLDAVAGAYMVLGDVDDRGQLESLLAGTPVKLLVNEIVRLTVGDRQVTLGGVELDFQSLAALETIRQLETLPGDNDIRILLAHRPDAVLDLPDGCRIDVVISGHTHGGQVVIPWFGPPVTLSNVPQEIAEGGLHQFKGNHIYVSRGVGSERGQAPLLRMFCPPEISLLVLGAQ